MSSRLPFVVWCHSDKRATRNGVADNHIAVHHQLANHNIDWNTVQCLSYSTNYFQRLNLESRYANLEQTPLNRCQQLPAPLQRLIHDGNEKIKTKGLQTDRLKLTNNIRISNRPI